MGKKIKSFLMSLLLLIVVVFVMLFLLEILIRNFFPQNLNYTMFDSILVYRHIPDFETKYFRQEFSNTIKFNSKGLRDYEYSYEKPKNTFRILLLGSSFSQALQVPLDHTYENILEKKLNSNPNKKYEKYEVINGAVGGYGTAQELLWLKTEGLKYSPDLILLDFSMRDITENSISQLIILKDGKLVENIPVKASVPKRALLYCSRYLDICSLIQSAILNNANPFTSKLKSTPAKAIGKPELFSKETNKEINDSIQKTFLLIKEIKKAADNNKIPILMFIIPHREQVDDSKLREFAKQNGLDLKNLEYDKVQKIMANFAAENKITSLDMLPYFRQKNINNTFYFNIDGHWNEKGHELAADLLFDYLTSKSIVK